jgi:hypothetical protein
MRLLERLLRDMGIKDGRFRLEWISGAEGDKVRSTVNEMTAKVRALGPLDLPGRRKDWDKELETLAQAAGADRKEAAHV